MDNDALAEMMLSLPDAVILLDDAGNFVWCNPAAERLFGRTTADVFGQPCFEFVHPEDLGLVALAFESLPADMLALPLEIRVLATDRWLLAEVVTANRADGTTLVTLRDVSERRRFEVAKDEDTRFRSLVHNAAAITMWVSPAGEVEAVSGAITRILGLPANEVRGQPLSRLAIAEDRDTLSAAILATPLGSPSTTRARFPTRDGKRTITLEIHTVNLLDDPTVNGFAVTAHDVDQQVATEASLHSALSLLNATLESTADGILVVDSHGSIAHFNQRFTQMWRIPDDIVASGNKHQAMAYLLEQLVHPDQFTAKITEMYDNPESESFDLLDFGDGRCFERFSRPQTVDGVVVGRVWSFRDLTDRKRLEEELVYRAFHDELTGLPNKTRFCDRLEHASDRAMRNEAGFAVLFCDLDNFKTVNDSLGHHAGDDLLVTAAKVLAGCLRAGDTAARLGGDEFAVLAEDLTDPDDARRLAARITESFRQPFRLGTKEVISTVSVGIAFGSSGTSSDQMLRNADLAMYRAKSRGKNRYECFEMEQHDAAVVRVEVEAELHRALEREEFTLLYQPMVDVHTKAIVAVEALVRWEHPSRGLLLPNAFIPVAEEAGLMDELGQRLLEQACRATRRWRDTLAPDLAVSVNASARQIAGEHIAGDAARVLETTGLEPSGLILEITETAMIQNTDDAGRNLEALHRMGVRLALDDFGTGYSSLTHLQQFPISIVKIDKSFVATIDNPSGPTLAPAVIQLALSLGLTTVAEGVENFDQMRRLRTLGCDLVQGFWLHRPMCADQLTELLSRDSNHEVAREVA